LEIRAVLGFINFTASNAIRVSGFRTFRHADQLSGHLASLPAEALYRDGKLP
jgi:hypothetical protein